MRKVAEIFVCDRCDGCGKLADTGDREPWSAWLDLPVKSAAAVMLGLVKPIPCDACGGSGEIRVEVVPATKEASK